MSRLVNLSDEIYAALTQIKKKNGQSYSEAIAGLLNAAQTQKTMTWAELAMKMKERAAKYKGKKEKTDHDLIAYGVSRDNP